MKRKTIDKQKVMIIMLNAIDVWRKSAQGQIFRTVITFSASSAGLLCASVRVSGLRCVCACMINVTACELAGI